LFRRQFEGKGRRTHETRRGNGVAHTELQSLSVDSAADAAPLAGDPKPLEKQGGNFTRYLGRAISLAVLVAIVLQLRNIDFAHVWSIVPTSPLFWLVFVVNYMVGSVGDWIIFKRLWNIPASGILALLRKQISNTLLFGYIGEVYFYDWARKRADIVGSPFGAVKDVAIMSAVMGNVVTLLSLALAWPLILQRNMGFRPDLIIYSMLFLIGSTLAIFVFRSRVFSLPWKELRFIALVHFLRIIVGLATTGTAWHLALPTVDLSWWVVLSVASMLLGRLPFISNKDFAFAALAVFLIGHDADIPALMTMMASLILATHVILGAVLMVSDVLSLDRRR
jgi:hypothetical protein